MMTKKKKKKMETRFLIVQKNLVEILWMPRVVRQWQMK